MSTATSPHASTTADLFGAATYRRAERLNRVGPLAGHQTQAQSVFDQYEVLFGAIARKAFEEHLLSNMRAAFEPLDPDAEDDEALDCYDSEEVLGYSVSAVLSEWDFLYTFPPVITEGEIPEHAALARIDEDPESVAYIHEVTEMAVTVALEEIVRHETGFYNAAA